MIGRVEVDTVPTRSEEDLGSHTVWTVVVEEAVSLSPLRVAFVTTGVVETDIAHGVVVWSSRVVIPSEGAAGDHSQTVGERLDLAVFTGSREVVGVDHVDGDRFVGCGFGVVVVELRCPVVGLVDTDGRGSATGCLCGLVGHRLVEVAATDDGVDMARDDTGVDDAIGSRQYWYECCCTRHSRVKTGRL